MNKRLLSPPSQLGLSEQAVNIADAPSSIEAKIYLLYFFIVSVIFN
jgi:hypothetical protein